tara:strand:+ start:153 stop:923 length:771 start_codon:yes stop_codon:yes gene_type:complete
MSRFDRRLKGADKKKPGSGAACVPQPIPARGPLLSGMMFGGRLSGQSLNINKAQTTVTQNQSLDNLVNKVSSTNIMETTEGVKISDNNIEMIHRRLRRLENSNNISTKTNKVYESLEKRLNALENMYSKNMENMEQYVRNQEDRINLLTADYRKTLETLNKIIKDVNMKIIDLDATTVKKEQELKAENLEEVKLEELPKATIVAVKAKPVIKKEETNEDVIAEVTEEILSKVEDEKQVKKKNVSLMIVEKDISNEN